MSSPRDLYHHSDQNPHYYESGPSPTVTQQSHSPGPSWMPAATTDDQSGYPQSHPSGSAVDAESDLEAMDFPFSHPQTNYPLQGTSFQVLNAQQDATYNNSYDLDFAQLYNYPDPHYRHSYPPSGSSHSFPGQSSADRVFWTGDLTDTLSGYYSHDFYGPQTSQGPLLDYRASSLTQLPSMDRSGLAPMYGSDSVPVQHTAERLKLEVNTASAELANAGAGQHSHSSPVAISPSNQMAAAGPSRPPPGSPERKRLLPLSADEKLSTARNVVPRSSRAWSVHSTSSDSHRRNRNSEVPGRGPSIPQDRYTTSSVSSFNTTRITFDLENPNQTGIPIVDILNKAGSFNRIRNHTQAFDHMGKKTFTLRVQWPGYKPWCKTIAALNWKKSRAPITRVKLAEDIATAIRDLLQKKRDEPFDPDYAAWNIGLNGIQLDQLCLVALHHVSKGSWQPELCLLQPPQR